MLKTRSDIYFYKSTYSLGCQYCWFQDAGCLVQIGGSDQMGNITSGQELISRAIGEKVSFAILFFECDM